MPVAQIRTDYVNNAVSATRLTYIHVDHLNTPRAMTDSTQTVVWRWDSDAFGFMPPNNDPDGNLQTDNLALRFPGQLLDADNGLNINGFREYDPSLGRYALQSDPIGLEGGNWSTFAYVNGQPVSLTDPSGLATYMCTQPLHALGGSGSKSGPDISSNPFYHQFIAIINSDGSVTTGGQDRVAGPWGQGKPSSGDGESYTNQQCKETEPDNNCIETCLKNEFAKPRPKYGLFGPGINCQEWAEDTLSKCRKICRK